MAWVFAAIVTVAQGRGFAACWARNGYTYEECCLPPASPSGGLDECFDALFTRERCCMEAHDDQECWDWAKFNLANTLQLMEARAAEAPSDALQLQAMALNRYMADDGLLYFFCCTSFHNEYCWGPAVPQALIPDVDAWEGL